VFVDLKTAWVIEGLGHGHAEVKSQGFVPGQGGANVSADAKLATYTEITPDNIDSFHFHGDPASFPVSAVIAVPHDRRASALLRGRYLSKDDPAQIVNPLETTQGLLQNIFRVGVLFDAVIVLVGGASLLALGLVFALSLRLRQKELHTIYLLGCSRATVLRLVSAEIVLIVLASAAVSWVLLQAFQHYTGDLVRHFVIP
jgi:putative ABC transport system permease protein